MGEIRAEAIELAGPHYECEDCWYSCPKSPEGCCNESAPDACTCGAEQRAIDIDAAITAAVEAEREAERNRWKHADQIASELEREWADEDYCPPAKWRRLRETIRSRSNP